MLIIIKSIDAQSIIQVIHIHLLVLLAFLGFNEAQEMGRPVGLMVKLLRICRNQGVLKVADDTQPNEAVVPYHVVRHHKEPHELF